MVRIYLAGEVQVEHGETLLREADLVGRQGRLVFAYLVVERQRAVDQAELAELLWPDRLPPSFTMALSAVVSKLRGVLGRAGLSRAEVIASSFGCYQLRLPAGAWVDLEAAASALDQAQSAVTAGEASAAYGPGLIAVTILKRPFLAGETGEWVERRRAEQAQRLVSALDCFAAAQFAHGEIEHAIAHAREAVRLEPFRESGYHRLMKLLEERGDRAEAVRVYEECRDLLARELGVRPSEELEQLRRKLAGRR